MTIQSFENASSAIEAEFQGLLAFLDRASASDSKVDAIFHSLITSLVPWQDIPKFDKREIRYILDLHCRYLTEERQFWDLNDYAATYKTLLGETLSFSQMVAKCRSLEGLYFDREHVDGGLDAWKVKDNLSRIAYFRSRLSELPHLRSIAVGLFHTHLSEEGVEAIASLFPKSLTKLSFSYSKLGDLTCIPALPALTSLTASSLLALPRNLTHLLNFPNLSELKISWDLCKIPPFSSRKSLDGHHDPEVTRQLLELHKLPRLEEVDFFCCKCVVDYTRVATEVLVPLTAMRRIGFKLLAHMSKKAQSEQIEPFIKRAYAILEASSFPRHVVQVTQVAETNLQDLSSGYKVLFSRQHLPMLYDLMLSYLDFRELNGPEFASIPEDQRKYWLNIQLYTKRRTLRFSDVEYFAACAARTLPAKTFAGSPLRHVLMSMMKSSPDLECLDCSRSSITDQGLKLLIAYFRNLRSLNLQGCRQLTHEGLKLLPKLEHLEELDLRYVTFLPPDREGSTEFLGSMPNLQRLFLNSATRYLYPNGDSQYVDHVPLTQENLGFIQKLDQLHTVDFDPEIDSLRRDLWDIRCKLVSNRAHRLLNFDPDLKNLIKALNLSETITKIAEQSPPAAFVDLFVEFLDTLIPQRSTLADQMGVR